MEAYNISRLSVVLTWTSPTDGTIAPTHYNITCAPTNGREFLGSATISANESSSHFNNNGTLYFDSKQHFALLALTTFRCSVEAIFVPGCNYSQFGEVVIHNQIGSNVQFDTSGDHTTQIFCRRVIINFMIYLGEKSDKKLKIQFSNSYVLLVRFKRSGIRVRESLFAKFQKCNGASRD